MRTLETKQIEDWAQFIEQNEIDFSCQTCEGQGRINAEEGMQECEVCSGSGYVEPIWNTIWNTGFHGTMDTPLMREPYPGVVAFEHDGEIWFGLTGCGMDMTPHLAAAWINQFPSCNWLPAQFCVTGCNLSGGYVESCVGKKIAKRVYKLMRSSLYGDIHEARRTLADLKEARKKITSKK